MNLSPGIKLLLVLAFGACSVYGFMIKLPSGFRHVDKEMHAAFYFAAAAFLNILFAKRNIIKHVLIFILLYLFGMAIEYGQEYSNTLLHKRIHGRYDPEDILWNTKGLIAFSAVWIAIVSVLFVYRKLKTGNTV